MFGNVYAAHNSKFNLVTVLCPWFIKVCSLSKSLRRTKGVPDSGIPRFLDYMSIIIPGIIKRFVTLNTLPISIKREARVYLLEGLY